MSDDVAGDDIRGRDAPAVAAPDDGGIGGRHRAKSRDGRLCPRLLDVAHGGVEQDDREDSDRLVWQRRVTLVGPQTRRDGGRHEQQDDEHILELRQEPSPRGNRLVAAKFVAPVLLESRLRLVVGETALQVRSEPGNDIIDVLADTSGADPASRSRRWSRGRLLESGTSYPVMVSQAASAALMDEDVRQSNRVDRRRRHSGNVVAVAAGMGLRGSSSMPGQLYLF